MKTCNTTSEISKNIDKKEGIIGQCLVCLRSVYRTQKHEMFSGDVMHTECYEEIKDKVRLHYN